MNKTACGTSYRDPLFVKGAIPERLHSEHKMSPRHLLIIPCGYSLLVRAKSAKVRLMQKKNSYRAYKRRPGVFYSRVSVLHSLRIMLCRTYLSSDAIRNAVSEPGLKNVTQGSQIVSYLLMQVNRRVSLGPWRPGQEAGKGRQGWESEAGRACRAANGTRGICA